MTKDSVKSQKLDRRVRKTRAQLLRGLTQLMQKKDIKDISVKELADLVDINRGTFYLHYRDIFDMLEKIEDELFQKFNRILDDNFPDNHTPETIQILTDIFVFLQDNQETVRALIGPHGDLAFINRLKELLKERLRYAWKQNTPHPENFDYYFIFVINGCIGMIETWLHSESHIPATQMARLANNMVQSCQKTFVH